MNDLNVLHSPTGKFSVLLHNISGTWKIVEGLHTLSELQPLSLRMGESGFSKRGYRVITIFLNNKCNLRCDYCRFDQVTHTGIEHGERDLDAVVKSVRALCLAGEHVDIHFQGGEPLLRLADIKYVCNELLASSNHFIPHFHVTTNGTIATEDALSILEDYGISITLSIDGLPELHDRHRPFANGKGSFAKVLSTLQLLQNRGIPFGVFCVVADPKRMRDMHEYLVNVLGVTSFVLAPLEIDGMGTPDELDLYLESFFEAQLELLERNLDRFATDGFRIREYLGELLLLGKVSPSFYSKACGDSPRSTCGERMHSIERNGEIRPCQNSRMVFNEGPEYIEGCLTRKGICDTCEIRRHCSTPICFSRLSPTLVRNFVAEDAGARNYVNVACTHLKKRELALFDLIYRRKQDVLNYLMQ
ncbi:MAG: radical SAM protein [Pseudomonadota bacterium]